MSDPGPHSNGEQADVITDSYASRVLRNEGRMLGNEQLARETRDTDRLLVAQRSDSLAAELERRAKALEELAEDHRVADNREHRDALAAYKECNTLALGLLRELYDAAIFENRKQSDEAVEAVENHSISRDEAVKQQVAGWRASDREARDLASIEVNRRLDSLNHADEKRQEFQATAVTRELFNADREAQTQREAVLRDQIIALDRALLGMTPAAVSEKAHVDIVTRFESAIAAASKTLDTRISVNSDKINDLKQYRDTQSGRTTGYQSVYGWIIAGVGATVGIITTVIIIANILTRQP